MRTIEEMKEIAIANLKKLKLMPEAIEKFSEDTNDVWCSERCRVCNMTIGVLYQINQPGGYTYEKECNEAIAYVRENGDLPYHVVQTNFEFGNVFAVLYISSNEEDDDRIMERDSIGDGYRVYAYCYNADDKDCSEYGGIGVKGTGGGIIRTC